MATHPVRLIYSSIYVEGISVIALRKYLFHLEFCTCIW